MHKLFLSLLLALLVMTSATAVLAAGGGTDPDGATVTLGDDE